MLPRTFPRKILEKLLLMLELFESSGSLLQLFCLCFAIAAQMHLEEKEKIENQSQLQPYTVNCEFPISDIYMLHDSKVNSIVDQDSFFFTYCFCQFSSL
jgi:hypothetical protein